MPTNFLNLVLVQIWLDDFKLLKTSFESWNSCKFKQFLSEPVKKISFINAVTSTTKHKSYKKHNSHILIHYYRAQKGPYIYIVYTRIFFTNWSTNNDLHSLRWAYQSLVFVLYMYTPPVCQVMNKRINKLVHCRLMSGTGIHSMGTRDYFPVIFVVNTLLCISLLIWLRKYHS